MRFFGVLSAPITIRFPGMRNARFLQESQKFIASKKLKSLFNVITESPSFIQRFCRLYPKFHHHRPEERTSAGVIYDDSS